MSIKRQLPSPPRVNDPALQGFLSAVFEVVSGLLRQSGAGSATIIKTVASSSGWVDSAEVNQSISTAIAPLVSTAPQFLIEEKKAQARQNIGAVSDFQVQEAIQQALPVILQGTAQVVLSAAVSGSEVVSVTGMVSGAAVLVSLAPVDSGSVDPATLDCPLIWAQSATDQVEVFFKQNTAITGTVRIHWLAVL